MSAGRTRDQAALLVTNDSEDQLKHANPVLKEGRQNMQCACVLGGGVARKEAPSPKLPCLCELLCPRRLALVGPRKAVKTRPNGRDNSRGKLKGRHYSVK